ncbi:MAG TPA: VOC family protein [Lysobacter sp.]|nr:VOC family protein [Lysobacter sp.]
MEFKVNRTIFHLSLPVHDLEETRAFYCSVLGAALGRVTPEWIDLIVFGHQVTFHQRPEQVVPPEAQGVQHFGAILPWEEWEVLCAAVAASGYPLLAPPAVFGKDTQTEHGKLLLRDPSGHMLEFKAYRHLGTVLLGNGPNSSLR